MTLRSFLEEIVFHDVDCSGVRSREQADWPIGANHQTIRSERFEGDIEKRNDLLRIPMLPVGLSDQAREFAEYVGKGGQPRDSLGPGIDVAGLDWRLGKVIEDKALARKAFGKFGGNGKMFGVDQDLVSKIEFFQDGNAAQEIWPQQKSIVGLTLYDMPNSDQFSISRQGFQL